jgi:phosphatidylserine/phosphatidylglycerophosphate/cardiolipin synthase-like enzyme
MIDVHFENIHSQIINHISQAESDLKICVAWFTDVDIYNSILEAQKKGVLVYLIIANHEINKRSKVDFKEFLQNKGYIGYIGNLNHTVSDKLMHNKFCIIDNDLVITGSYNWTFKARLNDENVIVIKNQPNVISKFAEKFESIKPQYGFTIKGNSVRILPIEQIMVKWEKKQSQVSPTLKGNLTKNITDKF